MAGGRRKKLHFSKLYSFSCGKSSFKDDHSRIGGPGFSRVVFCNDPDCFEAGIQSYEANYISTTKYTLVTFFPKSLFEQFRRVANIYFLVAGCLAFTPLAPYSAFSALLPLILVIGVSMVKEAIEDWKRKTQVYFAGAAYIFNDRSWAPPPCRCCGLRSGCSGHSWVAHVSNEGTVKKN